MGWTTTNPGGSYGSAQTYTVKGNWWGYKATISIARLAENQVSIRFVMDAIEGYNGYDPPYQYYLGVGSNYTHSYRFTDTTVYWTGTLNAGATVTTHTQGWAADTQAPVGTRQDKTFTGPAYTTKYTIAYSANGGSGAPASQTKTYGTALTLSTTVPTRAGYNFLGWATSSTATTAQYQPGGSYTANAAATLYAVWQIITYSVTYNGNGATGGSTAAQTKYYGTNLTLAQNGFTRTNYTFLYWNTKADGTGTTYAAGASYGTNAALALYAIWKKNNIPVYINDNGTIRQVEKAYMNVGGAIKECTVYLNVNGTIYTLV